MEKIKSKKTESKKNRGLLYILILLFIMLGIAGYLVYIHQKEAMEAALTGAKIPEKQVQITYADIDSQSVSSIQCQRDGNADGNIVDIVNQQISSVPAVVQNAFVENGWAIYVTDMNIGQTYYAGEYSQVMATTNYEEQRILIESRLDAAYESPIHEIGHWFDYYLGFPSSREEFAAIYNAESGSFIRTYGSTCIRDVMEFFAEGFWQYTVNPGRLQSVSPELYRFIKRQYCQLYIWTTWIQYSRMFTN